MSLTLPVADNIKRFPSRRVLQVPAKVPLYAILGLSLCFCLVFCAYDMSNWIPKALGQLAHREVCVRLSFLGVALLFFCCCLVFVALWRLFYGASDG